MADPQSPGIWEIFRDKLISDFGAAPDRLHGLTKAATQGGPEAATTMASGLLSMPGAGGAGLMMAGQDEDKRKKGFRINGKFYPSVMGTDRMMAAEAIDHVMENGTFMPSSESGQGILQGAGTVMEAVLDPVREKVDYGLEKGIEAGLPPWAMALPLAAATAFIDSYPGRAAPNTALNVARRAAARTRGLDLPPSGFGGIGDAALPSAPPPVPVQAPVRGLDADLIRMAEAHDPNMTQGLLAADAGKPMPQRMTGQTFDIPPNDAEIAALMDQPMGRRVDDVPANDGLLGQTGFGKDERGAVGYHGTDAKFDKFDTSYGDSGVGVQTFGKGHYLTESEQVAAGYQKRQGQHYRNASSNANVNGQPYTEFKKGLTDAEIQIMDSAFNDMAEGFQRSWFDDLNFGDEMLDSVEFKIRNTVVDPDNGLFGIDGQPLKYTAEQADALVQKLESTTFKKDAGYLYEADVNTDAFMDWDAPLSKQPELRAVIEKVLDDADANPPTWFEAKKSVDHLKASTGRAADNYPGRQQFADMSGGDVYKDLATVLGSDAKASQLLHESGIPGHRYKEGSNRNMVVFDDSSMPNQIKRDGRPIGEAKVGRSQRGSIEDTGGGKEVLKAQASREALSTLNVPEHFSQDTKSLVKSVERRREVDDFQDTIDLERDLEDRMYDLEENIGTRAAKKEANWLRENIYRDLETIAGAQVDELAQGRANFRAQREAELFGESGLHKDVLDAQAKRSVVTNLAERRQEIQTKHDEVINEIRMKVTEDIQDGITTSRIADVDPDSIHKIGDRFLGGETSGPTAERHGAGQVRLEVKKYNRVNDDGTVYYDVEQTFPDGEKGTVTLKNDNLLHAEKQGGLGLLSDDAIPRQTAIEPPAPVAARTGQVPPRIDLDTFDYHNPSPDHQRFIDLADEQRGAPEIAMRKAQTQVGGGVMQVAVEHVGDIIHRMSERTAIGNGDMGFSYVKPKVDRVLNMLRSGYGFEREFLENLDANMRYATNNPQYGPARTRESVDAALTNYANEHLKLEPFNDMQKAAQDAAVAIGQQDFVKARTSLETLERMLNKGPEAWTEAASETSFNWGRQRGSVSDTGGGKKVAKTQAARAGILEVIPEDKLKVRDFNQMKPGVRAQDDFNQKLSEARQSMDLRGRASVDAVLPEGFDGTTFITPDGMAGFAMSKDGYISHLFRHNDAPFAGTMGAALTKARAAGARNLDAIDAGLAESYVSRNTVESGRGPWDETRATQEMIDAFGVEKPDYVNMNIGGVVPTQKHSLLVPGGQGREQSGLLRYVPPRGEPQAVIDSFKGGRTARLNRLVEEGLAQSGDEWYYMGGMLDQFIAELGPKLGVERFDKLMALNAAVSPRSTVNQQIKRSSILYQRHVRGEDITDMYQPLGTESNPKNLEPAFPAGYGHLAHGIHMKGVGALEGGASLSPLSQQKIASYYENLRGNYQPLTGDTHNYQILTGNKKSPTLAQYPYLESRQADLGARLDLQPAEWQSALWVGGKDITGVKDARNFPDAMNQRIAKTAEVLNIPEAEVMIRFINGDTQLYSVMGAMFLAPAALEKLSGGEAPANET